MARVLPSALSMSFDDSLRGLDSHFFGDLADPFALIHAVAAVRRGTKEDRIGGAPGDALGQALRYLASDTLACFGIAQSSQHFLATSVVHPVLCQNSALLK